MVLCSTLSTSLHNGEKKKKKKKRVFLYQIGVVLEENQPIFKQKQVQS
jgi:hypothetical protein